VRDQKAVNGRIIDGQIVEVSLVDRPANPNAKLMLAKSVDGEPALVQVEEFIDTDIEKHPGHSSQAVHGKPGGGSKPGAGGVKLNWEATWRNNLSKVKDWPQYRIEQKAHKF